VIHFERNILNDLGEAANREWLETNGIGGFASSTIAGHNSRRYHGLLTAATKPPLGRAVLLSKLEEVVTINGRRYELSTNTYPGTVHPHGYSLMREFRLDPFPTWTFDLDVVELDRSVFMVHGANTTVVRYEIRSKAGGRAPLTEVACELNVRPLLAYRDYHALGRERTLDLSIVSEPGRIAVTPDPTLPTLRIAHDADRLDERAWWYRDQEYAVERERGFDFHEDLASPCSLSYDLSARSVAWFVASPDELDVVAARELERRERERRANLRAAAGATGATLEDEFERDLVVAADQFIVKRDDGKSVIAGYHWFGDWGRDTMIALPGLAIATRRFDVARDVLLAFARYVDRGMLPNRFPDQGEAPEYNTVDSTLWYFEAVRSLAETTGDYDFVREHLYATLADIVSWHVRGTRYGIKLDDDGLLTSGEEGVQLTWMDAKVGDWVVTPRRGKPVEIQALWYNALRVLEAFARTFNDTEGERQYRTLAERARSAFEVTFWNEAAGCLYDVVDTTTRDGAMRPNQILAVSLPYPILTGERATAVVDAVERDLLTPFGLRSLSANDAAYVERYEGDSRARDAAYHQGTVWSWLLGPFVTAYLGVHGESEETRAAASAILAPIRDHLRYAGIGQISEIFDAESPHAPRGCIAQAWSVGEVLRCAILLREGRGRAREVGGGRHD